MLDEKYSSYAEKVLSESDKSDTRRIYKDIFHDSNVVIHENCIMDINDLLLKGREYGDQFIIPAYQRGLVWSENQKVNLIKTIMAGVPIGTFVFARQAYDKQTLKKLPARKYYLLDGQQRLNAIRGFLDNEFAMDGYFFPALPSLAPRAFLSFPPFGSLILPAPPLEPSLAFSLTFHFGFP
ncbi:DUF262 domain-containing protein, partial [Campylobacter concisus]|uniref:DUF262 domain-containing protein n=1 Tax=Campylobacter concisus TaxID=199 RepID=UPI00112F8AFE